MSQSASNRSGNLLLAAILAGAILGVLLGGFFPEGAIAIGFLGKLFLNALFMIIIPLVMASMIVGVSRLGDARKLGRIGGFTVGYYLVTTLTAVIIGIILVNLIRPGEAAPPLGEPPSLPEKSSLTQVLIDMVSPNIFQSMSEMKVLPVIIFSLFFGVVLTTLGARGQKVIEFIDTVNDAILKMVRIIMWYAPVGIMALVAARLGEAGGLEGLGDEGKRVGLYMVTVVAGLSLHGLIVLPIILYLVGKVNPYRYAIGMAPALTTAFSTASSSATLPVTTECTETRNRVSKESSGFVLPLGATINMDGTALYEAVAAIFIAQAYGIALEPSQQIVIVLTATLAAIGAAGVPEAGLVTLVIVVESVGLPREGIGLILAVDWLLDRCRTTVNVWGDSIGAAVIDRFISTGAPGNREESGDRTSKEQ